MFVKSGTSGIVVQPLATCQQFTVGLSARHLADCNVTDDVETMLANCPDFRIRQGYFYLQLLASFVVRPARCSRSLYRYRTYSEENDTQLARDLRTGNVDIYTIEQTFSRTAVNWYFATTPLHPVNYNFYARLDHETTGSADRLQQASYLRAPFRRNTWLLVLFAVGTAAVLKQINDSVLRSVSAQQHGRCGGSKFADGVYGVGVLLPLVAIALAYSSLLKALVIRPSSNVPFRSISELTQRLGRGELQIVLEDLKNRRNAILRDESYSYSEQMRSLVQQINSMPDTVRALDSMDQVCMQMRNSSNIIFLGFDELLLPFCNDLCFYKFPVHDVAVQYSTFHLTRNLTISDEANLATYALPNFSNMMISRMAKKNCEHSSKITNCLTISSLFYAFALICSSWLVSVSWLVFEILWFHYQSKRR